MVTAEFQQTVTPLLEAIRSVIKQGPRAGISFAAPESKSSHTVIFSVQLDEGATEKSAINAVFSNLKERKSLGLLYGVEFVLDEDNRGNQLLMHCTSGRLNIEHLTIQTSGHPHGMIQLVYSSARIVH